MSSPSSPPRNKKNLIIKDEAKDLSFWRLNHRGVLRYRWLGCFSRQPFLSQGTYLDVVLRGYSGYNTRWALKVLDRVFPTVERGGAHDGAPPPLAITVFFGANDACLPDRYGGFQHVPLSEYKQNLHSIVSSLKNRWPKTLILLITPPPIDEDERLRHPYVENPSGLPERTNEAAGFYAKACVEHAVECGIPVVDLWNRMQQYSDWRKAYLRDGLHLTQEGNKVVFEEVMKKLNESGISPEKLKPDLPLFADIDRADPLKAFSALV